MLKSLFAASFLASGLAVGPATLIGEKGFPVFERLVNSPAFALTVTITIKSTAVDEEPGNADFVINVRLPTPSGEPAIASGDCPGAEYVLSEDTLLFDPYGEPDSCTGKFVEDMNTALAKVGIATRISSPIPLKWSADDNQLYVSIMEEVEIPFAGFVLA